MIFARGWSRCQMKGTRGAGEPDMCTDRMRQDSWCRYGLCIRSVFRNSTEQQDHLKMKSALAAHVSRRPWKECSRKRICNSRSPSGRFAFFLTHAHYSYIFVLSYFFSPEMYNSLAGGHEALIFLHHKI